MVRLARVRGLRCPVPKLPRAATPDARTLRGGPPLPATVAADPGGPDSLYSGKHAAGLVADIQAAGGRGVERLGGVHGAASLSLGKC